MAIRFAIAKKNSQWRIDYCKKFGRPGRAAFVYASCPSHVTVAACSRPAEDSPAKSAIQVAEPPRLGWSAAPPAGRTAGGPGAIGPTTPPRTKTEVSRRCRAASAAAARAAAAAAAAIADDDVPAAASAAADDDAPGPVAATAAECGSGHGISFAPARAPSRPGAGQGRDQARPGGTGRPDNGFASMGGARAH